MVEGGDWLMDFILFSSARNSDDESGHLLFQAAASKQSPQV
jgi:hypothetical protein